MGNKTKSTNANLEFNLDAMIEGVPTVSEVQRRARKHQIDLSNDPEYVAGLLQIRFVHAVREALDRLGWSQAELARRLNKKPQYVSRVLDEERGENFTILTMAEFACALGLEFEILTSRRVRRPTGSAQDARTLNENPKSGLRKSPALPAAKPPKT